MKFMKKSLLIFLVCHLSLLTASAQQKVVLDLDRTVRLATDSSLSVQKYQNDFYASQHRYLLDGLSQAAVLTGIDPCEV